MPHCRAPPENIADREDYFYCYWCLLEQIAQDNRKMSFTSQVPDLTSFPSLDNSPPTTCPTDLGFAGLLGSNTSLFTQKQKNDNYISASSKSPAQVVDSRRKACVSQLVKILLQLMQRLHVCSICEEHEDVKTKAYAKRKRLMERVLLQDCLSNKRHDEVSRNPSDIYINCQSITNSKDMIVKTIDVNLLQECKSIECEPSRLTEGHVKHQDPVVKGLSKYLWTVARKGVCLTNSEQICNILPKQESDDIILQRNCSYGKKSGDRAAGCPNSSDRKSSKDSSSSNNSNSSFSGAGSSNQAEDDDDGDEERGNGRKGMEQRNGKCKRQKKTLRSKLRSRLRSKVKSRLSTKIMTGLRSTSLSIVRRKFWRVIPKTLSNRSVNGPRKKEKGGYFVGFRASLSQTGRGKSSLKPPGSPGQAREKQIRKNSSFQDPFSSSRFPQDQLSKFKNGPWINNALRVRWHVLVAGASYPVQLPRKRPASPGWGKRRNHLKRPAICPSRGESKGDCWQYQRQKSRQAIDGETPIQCTDNTQGEFCGTPSDFSSLDIGDSAVLVTPHLNSAAAPPRLNLRRGYAVHQQCDEDLGMQEQTDHGLRPTSSHAGTEDIEDDVNDIQLHRERADNRLLHILIVVIMGIILYTPLWSSDFTDNVG